MAFAKGVGETWELTSQTFVLGVGKLATGKLGVNTLGGPISIFYMAGTSYESGGWNSFFRLMAILSITLPCLESISHPLYWMEAIYFSISLRLSKVLQ